MNAYQAYLKDISNYSYYSEWEEFTNAFINRVCEDEFLKKLRNEYQFLEEQWPDLEIEITHSITEELQWIPHIYGSEITFNELCTKLAGIAQSTIQGVLLANFNSYSYINEYNFNLETDRNSNNKKLEFKLEMGQVQLKDISLNKEGLSNFIINWNTTNTSQKYAPLIFVPPTVAIIEKIEEFDTSLYLLLQKNPTLLKELDWRIFEEMLADILKTFGYSIELTKKTKDGGIDIIAIKSDINFGNHKYILQAKRYNDSVQVSPVRELLFIHQDQKASKSCLATTSIFTKGALALQEKYKWVLELKDQKGILEWIDRVVKIKSLK